MKHLIFTCLIAVGLVSLVGCSCDKHTASTSNESASMQTDSKDMQNHH